MLIPHRLSDVPAYDGSGDDGVFSNIDTMTFSWEQELPLPLDLTTPNSTFSLSPPSTTSTPSPLWNPEVPVIGSSAPPIPPIMDMTQPSTINEPPLAESSKAGSMKQGKRKLVRERCVLIYPQ